MKEHAVKDTRKPTSHFAIPRRQFLQFLGVGAALPLSGLEAACMLLRPTDDGNPLARKVSREWEKI